MAGIKISDLRIGYANTTVIEGLDLEVLDGEFLVLLGPSGCGKSTLLHGIAGLQDVAAGTIAIGGVDMTHADPTDRNIGMVFQSYALYPTMSVERNMSFSLRVKGFSRQEIARRVERAAQMLQLTELLQRKPASLSGGHWCAMRVCFCLTSRCPIWMPSCVPNCAASSNCSISAWAPPWST